MKVDQVRIAEYQSKMALLGVKLDGGQKGYEKKRSSFSSRKIDLLIDQLPKSSLERRVRKARESVDTETDSDNDTAKIGLSRFKPVQNIEQEEQITT